MTWLHDGDASAQFFKQHASHRRRCNAIMSLRSNDSTITGHEEIAEAVDLYLEGIIGSMPQRERILNFDTLGLPRLDLAHLEDIIKGDFMRALDCFFRGDMRGLHAINKALVTLIPKIDGAEEIMDFPPVSLVQGAIKIFDKVLSVRLTEDLPRLAGVHQSAFVRGRSMHDNFMLVQCTARKLHPLRNASVMV
ncbi:uncharacterized protein [Aegilops tauschii subsp. strangulata]|uniref:uncharacterized protein n=1 Tax=Aegilops tauschii subsp. strangulata TaxID=200361 RepID=UPI003CC89FCD